MSPSSHRRAFRRQLSDLVGALAAYQSSARAFRVFFRSSSAAAFFSCFALDGLIPCATSALAALTASRAAVSPTSGNRPIVSVLRTLARRYAKRQDFASGGGTTG